MGDSSCGSFGGGFDGSGGGGGCCGIVMVAELVTAFVKVAVVTVAGAL